MTQIDWVAKLTSRKFWMAVCGLVSGLLLAFRVDESMVTEITGCIMAAASVVAYIIGEGLADAAGAKADTYVVEPETHPPEDDQWQVGWKYTTTQDGTHPPEDPEADDLK